MVAAGVAAIGTAGGLGIVATGAVAAIGAGLAAVGVGLGLYAGAETGYGMVLWAGQVFVIEKAELIGNVLHIVVEILIQ